MRFSHLTLPTLLLTLTLSLICPRLAFAQDSAVSPDQSAASTAESGPFGLKNGLTQADVEKLCHVVKKEGDWWTVDTVPKPHKAFEMYSICVPDGIGICKIVALGVDVETSVYGSSLHSAFDDMETALAKRYGKHKTYDFLRSGSIWDETRDWMMGLLKEERTLMAFWSSDKDAGSDMPGQLSSVSLRAKALSTEKGFLSVSYEFKDFAAYVDKKKAKEGNAL